MNRYAALMALASFAVACKGDDCDPDVEDCDNDTNVCDNSVDEVFPANGATDAYYRTTVEAKLDDAETDATITVTGPDGEVAGTSTVDNKTVIFVPSAALAPSTTYTVTVDFSCGKPETTFTTSEVGSIADIADIEGKTYSLDLASGRFVEPAGIGSLLSDFVDQEVLIGVQAATATDIQMIGAIADGATPPAQGECDPTINFPEAEFTGNPFFQIGPETTTLSVAGYTVTIEELEISGAFSPDGSYIAGAVLAGTLDTRPLVPILNADDDCSVGAPRCADEPDAPNCCDEDAICNLAGQIGVSCTTCANDGKDYCLTLFVDSMQAELVANTTVEPQHAPVDNATAPIDSTNICDIPACSGSEDCL